MVKTPKKSVPGADERKRAKSTNHQEIAPKKQSDNSNRPKPIKPKKKSKDDQPSGSKEPTPPPPVMEPPPEDIQIQPLTDEIVIIDEDIKNGEPEDTPSETTTESYSVDIVESTTSELSEPPTEPSSQNEKSTPNPTEDVAFALKDVQIKLNDCLKETRNTPEPANKDISFGQSLRSISGRNSLGRMRRFSPSNSLYVNTSGLSLAQGEESDLKLFFSTNGTTSERKRKLLDDDENEGGKRGKFQSDNILINKSISRLRELRNPIDSTLDYDRRGDLLEKENGDGRKWCLVM